MARRRDVPPDVPDDAPPPPGDDPRAAVPPEDMPTQPIDVADPYAREPRTRERVEEVYEDPLPPEEPPRSWMRENLWVWLLILLLLVVGGIALLWFLQRDDDGDRAVVPSVVGMTEADAVREISDAGLEPVANPGESERPRGIVFAQSPGGGSQLKDGEPVVISISTGPPSTTTVTTTTTETVTQPPPPANVTLADVVGQNQVEAGDVLEGNGVVADSYPVPSDEPAGTVISQNPAAGTVVKEGDTVRLNVSLGPGPREESSIPDVTGVEATEARNRARVEGFTVRTVERQAPSPEEVGEVLTQTPAAGTAAPVLTQITVYVGR
jgi:eukaryotic-like serine/threonine-protein kinase